MNFFLQMSREISFIIRFFVDSFFNIQLTIIFLPWNFLWLFSWRFRLFEIMRLLINVKSFGDYAIYEYSLVISFLLSSSFMLHEASAFFLPSSYFSLLCVELFSIRFLQYNHIVYFKNYISSIKFAY